MPLQEAIQCWADNNTHIRELRQRWTIREVLLAHTASFAIHEHCKGLEEVLDDRISRQSSFEETGGKTHICSPIAGLYNALVSISSQDINAITHLVDHQSSKPVHPSIELGEGVETVLVVEVPPVRIVRLICGLGEC